MHNTRKIYVLVNLIRNSFRGGISSRRSHERQSWDLNSDKNMTTKCWEALNKLRNDFYLKKWTYLRNDRFFDGRANRSGHFVVSISSGGRPVHHLVLVLSWLQERELDLVTSKTGQSILKLERNPNKCRGWEILKHILRLTVKLFFALLLQYKGWQSSEKVCMNLKL